LYKFVQDTKIGKLEVHIGVKIHKNFNIHTNKVWKMNTMVDYKNIVNKVWCNCTNIFMGVWSLNVDDLGYSHIK